MILGMATSTFTLVHVVLSLAGIGTGFIVLYGLLTAKRLDGWTVVCAVVALYLNVFVAVVQAFEKVPALKAMAPTQSEPPFLVTQLAVLALFIALAIVAAKKFRAGSVRAA